MKVIFWDGKTRKGPMTLPTSATKRLDGSGTISKITNEADANACGYYYIERATATAGYVIVSTSWPSEPDGNGVFVEVITEEITEAAKEQADKEPLKDTITQALTDPITAVLVRAIRFLGNQHGFTDEQINTKLIEWTEAEAGL
jgi:predicted carbohydrate-binding protein with CBM5 and CBM33 domain|tara:strand:- start:1595 stop:2026 length:432 start_codon:yes stop_codon:yes gene_type:complete